jgi:hypothetical protein
VVWSILGVAVARTFNTSTSLQDADHTAIAGLSGKEKGSYQLHVQGSMAEELREYLITEYGVPKKYIDIV